MTFQELFSWKARSIQNTNSAACGAGEVIVANQTSMPPAQPTQRRFALLRGRRLAIILTALLALFVLLILAMDMLGYTRIAPSELSLIGSTYAQAA